MEETTSNSFAICLVYYYNYCRNKLVREDLLKIRRKYERKPSQLLIDLRKKYVFDMAEKVNVQSVLRVVGSFDIPDEYIAVAGLSEYVSSQSPKYDQRVDITSQDFDVDLAFQCGTIFCSFKTCPMEDNMSKARKYVAPLLPDDERGESEIQSKEAQGMSKSASRRVAALAAKEKEKEERRPFFERLADVSIPKYVMRNEMGVETTLPSPLALLYDFMQRKERVLEPLPVGRRRRVYLQQATAQNRENGQIYESISSSTPESTTDITKRRQYSNRISETDLSQKYIYAFVNKCLHGARIWDLISGKCKQTLRGHVDSVNAASWQPFSANVCTASGDKTVSVWDGRTGLCVQTLYGHANSCNHLAVTNRGDIVISADADGVVKVWDIRMVAELGTIDVGQYPVNKLAVDRGGSRAIAACDDGTCKVLDMQNFQVINEWAGHDGPVQCVAIAPNDGFAAAPLPSAYGGDRSSRCGHLSEAE